MSQRALITARKGLFNWPSCAKCLTPVEAYGVDDETPTELHVWARCHGERDGSVVKKSPHWTMNNVTATMALLVFFAPSHVT